MDISQPTTTTEARALIGIVQYHRDMCPRCSHVLDNLKEVSRNPKGRAILWNGGLEVASREIKRMVSANTLLNHPDWTISFTLQTDASDKYLDAVISQNDKPISFFLKK